MQGQITFQSRTGTWVAECEVRDVSNNPCLIQITTRGHEFMVLGIDDKIEVIAVSESIDSDMIGERYLPPSNHTIHSGGRHSMVVLVRAG